MCRQWLKLNENTIIKVKTANCTTKETTASCVGQGSAWGVLNSNLNLDREIQAYSEGSSDEYYYGSVRCQGVVFQDDTARVSFSVKQAQAGYQVRCSIQR